MRFLLIPLLQGLAAVFAVTGVGRLALRLARVEQLPWFWNLALSALAGQFAVSVLVEAALLIGLGSPLWLRLLAGLLVGVGLAGHLNAPRTQPGLALANTLLASKPAAAVLILAWLINLVVALAPSTKIDELYYHMLMPRRIVEDGGLRFYRLPLLSAMVPHMHYQISLSVMHALGAPDAGNVVSWGYSIVLSLFVIGFLMDAARDGRLAVLCGALCSAGVYATVWHTTGGPHALGDLATVAAVAGVLRPNPLLLALKPVRYTLLLAATASVAAATKLSLWPLALVMSVLVVYRAGQKAESGWTRAAPAGLATLPWIVLHLPLMIWTYAVSGSFWGPVLANRLAPSAFPATILQELAELQGFHPGALLPMLRYAVVELSPVFFAAVPWLVWTAWRGSGTSRIAGGLLAFQGALVAWKLHFDFRFLGGLEYVAVLAAALTMTLPASDSRSSDSQSARSHHWPQLGEQLERSRHWILLLFAVPWLCAQAYYARPFAEVVSGLMPRAQFLERYVAMHRDFEALDRILPRDAVLYVGNNDRLPNFYVPRPVVLTPLDLRGREPVYRLTLQPIPGLEEAYVEEIDATSILRCGPIVYSNERAIVVTFRTPGAVPIIGNVYVQSCRVEAKG